MPSDSKYKRVITRSLKYVAENADRIHELLVHLLTAEVITPDEMERVEAAITKSDKLRTLTLLFLRKRADAFEGFVTALKETKNEHVEEHIEGVRGEVARAPDEQSSSDRRDKDKKKRKKKKSKKEGRPWMRILVHCSDSGDESDAKGSGHSGSDSDSDSDSDAESETGDEDIEKLAALILFVRDEIRKRAHYHIDQEYTAPRFRPDVRRKIRALKKPKWDSAPILTGAQHFSVNCSVWLSRVGFWGPASIATTSYSVHVELIRTPTWKPFSEAIVIGVTDHVVQVSQGQLIHVPFRVPLGVEPHLWYKLAFKIVGSDPMTAGHRDFALSSATVRCFTGDVRFEYTNGMCNSTTKLAEMSFFKGKERLVPLVFPSTSDNQVTFRAQQDVRDWQEAMQGDPNEPPGAAGEFNGDGPAMLY